MSSSCFYFFASFLSIILSFDLLAIINSLRNLNISIFFQLFLSSHFQEFTVFLVKLLCNKLGCFSINSLVACRLAVEFAKILCRLLSLFARFTLNLSLGFKKRLYFFLEVLKEAPETEDIKVFLIMFLENSLVCFCNVSEFSLGIRRGIILWMVFYSQFSVSFFGLVQCSIITNLQNFVRIKLLSSTLREKLLEKFFFTLIFQLIFFEKPFEGVMWINLFKLFIGLRNKIISMAFGAMARPKNPSKREDSITEIMERSIQILLHQYSFLIILFLD